MSEVLGPAVVLVRAGDRPGVIQAIEYRRELCRQSLVRFAEVVSRGTWVRAKHLIVLANLLEATLLKPHRRLLIQMPRRHGKSELASKYFPAWLAYKHPDRRTLLGSYEAEFAAEWGRKSLQVLQENKELLGMEFVTEAAHNWTTKQGGGMSTAGVGGPFTGKGASGALIVDDPVKNWEQANSKTYRDSLWDWWRSTAYTGLERGAPAIVIMTRWHQDDLVGRILAEAQAGGEQWDIVNLPALAEAGDKLGRNVGEPLWPDHFGSADFERIQRAVGPGVWASLYQQRPSPEGGGLFKNEWWRFWRHAWESDVPGLEHRTIVLPATFDEWLQSWDTAQKKKQANDSTVGQVWSRKGARFFLRDMVWRRMELPEILLEVARVSGEWPEAVSKYIEDKSSGPDVIAMLEKEVFGLIPVNPGAEGKYQRASAITPLIQSGSVFLPLHHRQRDEMIEQLSNFPNGVHDDVVDCMSQALGQWLYVKHDPVTHPLDPDRGHAMREVAMAKARETHKQSQERWRPRRRSDDEYV